MSSSGKSGYAHPKGNNLARIQAWLSYTSARSDEVTFIFEADFVKYLELQNTNLGPHQTLSDDIRLISAGSDDNVLALPVGTYVKDVWEEDGTKILEGIERASMEKNLGRTSHIQARMFQLLFLIA